MTTLDEFRALIEKPEGVNIEFKSATGGFHFDELVKYCVALANEGGGKIIPGVTDGRPRRVSGTRAFPEPGRTEAGLFDRLGHKVPIEELDIEGLRALIVHVPPRLVGTVWQDRGTFWMRSGDALIPMSDDRLRRIHDEGGPDFSAEICQSAKLGDLDPASIETLRRLWQRKAPNQDLANRPVERLLVDSELVFRRELMRRICFGNRIPAIGASQRYWVDVALSSVPGRDSISFIGSASATGSPSQTSRTRASTWCG